MLGSLIFKGRQSVQCFRFILANDFFSLNMNPWDFESIPHRSVIEHKPMNIFFLAKMFPHLLWAKSSK